MSSDLAAMLAGRTPGDDVDLIIADYLDAQPNQSVPCPNPECWGGESDEGVYCSVCGRTGRLRALDFRLAHALKQVCTHPAEDWPRLAYAEVLENYAGTVACEKCKGTGGWKVDTCNSCGTSVEYQNTYVQGNLRSPTCPSCGWRSPQGIEKLGDCPTCRGDGRVSDGNRERAAFIRCQVELARLETDIGYGGRGVKGEGVNAIKALRRRERELLEAHRAAWTNVVPGYTIDAWSLDEPMLLYVYGARCKFRRGFIDSLTLSAADWLRVHEGVYWNPGQTVTCEGCYVGGLTNTTDGYTVKIEHQVWGSYSRTEEYPKQPLCRLCRGKRQMPRPFVVSATRVIGWR